MSNLTLSSRAASAQPEKTPQHLQCSACSRAVFNAYQTPHGCRLCETCVQRLPTREKTRCPGNTEACRDEEEEIDICQGDCFPDIASRREVAKLRVRCPNQSDGCGEQMKWREVESHLMTCEYEKATCTKCGELVPAKQLEYHMLNDCTQRIVECRFCRESVVWGKMESEHCNLRSPVCCKLYTDSCPYCREPNLKKADFDRHKPACRECPTPCPFKHLGCNEELPNSEIERHCQESADKHLELISRRIDSLTGGAGAAASSSASAPAAAAAAMALQTSSQPPASDKEIKEFERKLLNLFEVFKKLQLNAATWANTTMDYEELLKAFNGINGFRGTLKSLDDRARQLESGGGGGGGSGRLSTDSPAAAVDDFRRLNERISELRFRLNILEQTNYEGVLTWKIDHVSQKRNRGPPLYSSPFYLQRYGYTFRIRLDLSGAGESSSHVSVALVVIQGEYDDILDWPLVADVTFRLLNPRERRDDLERQEKLETPNRGPANKEDLSINCCSHRFLHINQLEKFLKNDCLYLEAEVEQRTNAATATGGAAAAAGSTRSRGRRR